MFIEVLSLSHFNSTINIVGSEPHCNPVVPLPIVKKVPVLGFPQKVTVLASRFIRDDQRVSKLVMHL